MYNRKESSSNSSSPSSYTNHNTASEFVDVSLRISPSNNISRYYDNKTMSSKQQDTCVESGANSVGGGNHADIARSPESNSKVVKHGESHSQAMNSFKLLLLIMMVLQNSSTVLVGRYTRASKPKEELYSVNHLLLVIEVTKFLMSAGLEFYTSKGRLYENMLLHIFQRPMDAMKISVPALLYLVQNTLLYVALSNLTAPIFQVTYQGKLVTTALVSVVMLQRSYSMQQWICLVALSLGVATVVLDSSSSSPGESKTEQSMTVGLIAVTIACLSSALAGVYFEFVLKKPSQPAPGEAATQPASLWMRNMQLAFFSVVVAACQGEYNRMHGGESDELAGKPYFHGFTFWAWILVLLQAGGGLLVAAVIKYADNVLKGLATGVSVVFATALSTVLFGTPLSFQFVVGATMILISVYLFSNPLPARFLPGAAKGEDGKPSQEMNKLLPK